MWVISIRIMREVIMIVMMMVLAVITTKGRRNVFNLTKIDCLSYLTSI